MVVRSAILRDVLKLAPYLHSNSCACANRKGKERQWQARPFSGMGPDFQNSLLCFSSFKNIGCALHVLLRMSAKFCVAPDEKSRAMTFFFSLKFIQLILSTLNLLRNLFAQYHQKTKDVTAHCKLIDVLSCMPQARRAKTKG
jgi:hypothetical protein